MTASFPVSTRPAVLMHLKDVLAETFKGKQYEVREKSLTPVPEHVMKLWEERGYRPAEVGVAVVIFFTNAGASKPYTYPLYLWREV